MQPPEVALIVPPYHRRPGSATAPPLGILSLAAAVRAAGANVQIIDLALELPDFRLDRVAETQTRAAFILEQVPFDRTALIGIGPLVTATLEPTRYLVAALRKLAPTAHIVIGGPLCSAPGFRDVAFAHIRVDSFVKGDGEIPLLRLWQSLQPSVTSVELGVGVNTPAKTTATYRHRQLDTLALPARELALDPRYQTSIRRRIPLRSATAVFSRGCSHRCDFCAAAIASGTNRRRVTSSRISEEFAQCKTLGFEDLVIYDDCGFSSSDPGVLEREVRELIGAARAASWTGYFQIELPCDVVAAIPEDMVVALHDAGCRQINMGIEKGSYRTLRGIGKKQDISTVRRACEKLSGTQIRAAATFILGGPGESLKDIDETISFAASLSLDMAKFYPLALYPGTRLFRRCHPEVRGSAWLAQCLDRSVAPFGDILWRSDEVHLSDIAERLAAAYVC